MGGGLTAPHGEENWGRSMIQNVRDFKTGVGFSVFCLFLIFFLIPRQVGSLTEPDAMMPVLITLFLLVLSIILVVKSISQRVPAVIHHEENETRMSAGKLWTVVAAMAAYAWLLDITGFLLTSLCAMVGLFLLFGVRDFKRIILITAITLGVLYFSFEKLLYAPLPVGVFFENIMG
jgi:hypothetical protein